MRLYGSDFFSFKPLFLLFFKRLSYLPPSIQYANIRFSRKLFNFYFFKMFAKKGRLLNFTRIFKRIQSKFWSSHNMQFLKKQPEFGLFLKNLSISVLFFKPLIELLTNIKFIFYFFFRKLNKKLYRFSKQKRPRYSIIHRYLPPFRRFKFILKFLTKSLIHEEGSTFYGRLSNFFFNYVQKPKTLFAVDYILKLQKFIFKEHRRKLLYS